jgi:hypothetical protein
VKTPDQIALLREMVAEVDAKIAAAARADRDGPYPFDGALVGRAAQRWLYEFPVPQRATFGDAPVEVHSRDREVRGWVAAIADGRCTVALNDTLGPRAVGWVDIDTAAPLRALRTRLTEVTPDPRSGGVGRGFRIDQAALVLGAPGGRLRDDIAKAAESTDTWSLDDRQANVIGTALRHRWAFVQPPPDGNATALLVQLLDRLLAMDATVLVVSPHAAAVDWSLYALCDQLRPQGDVRSGEFQRLGPIAVRPLEERHGELVDPDIIAADLNAELDRQAAALDEAELRLRHEEAVRRYAHTEELHDELTDRLERTRHRGKVARLRSSDRPDELVVALHQLRPQRAAAKQERDRIAAELAAAPDLGPGLIDPFEADSGPAQTFGERLRVITDARDDLVDARANIDEALRRRCRLAATTTGQAYTRRLPRESFDVVVIVGRISRSEAFYLAGLSTRSVVAVGAPRAMPLDAEEAVRPPAHVARFGPGRGARQHGAGRPTLHYPASASD